MRAKLEIYNKLMLNNYPKIFIDPFFRLIDKLPEIVNLTHKSYNFTKFLYFNKSAIHSILYDSETMIEIINRLSDDLLSFYFYLGSLIQDNSIIINYLYNYDLIERLQKRKKNNYLYKIIKAKLIQILFYNYTGLEIVDQENVDKAAKIEKENLLLLDNNIFLLEENNINLNENDIKEGNIETVFIKIILFLIKNDKFTDFNYMNEMTSSLDLENIDLTKFMYEELVKEINSNRDYFQKFKISNLNDLSNINKIYFHYFLLKYILKSSIFIYQISFLSENRKNIIKMIKQNNFPNFENREENLKNIINYVIRQYLDSPYYYHVYNKKKDNALNELIKNEEFQKGFTDSKTSNNGKRTTNYTNENTSKISEKERGSEKSNDNYLKEEQNLQRQILNSSTFTFHTNERGKEPFIIFDIITFGKQKINITDFFEKIKKKKNLELNFQKFLEFLEKFEEKIKTEYKNNYCLRLKLLFQNENEKINSIFNNKEYNILCKYSFYNPIDNNELTFKTENILVNNFIESEGFIYLMEEINNDIYKDEKYKYNENEYIISEYNSKNQKVNSKINNNHKEDNTSFYNLNYTFQKKDISNDIYNRSTLGQTKIEENKNASKEQIISPISIIYKHYKSAKYCGQLSNGFYLSYGEGNSIFIFGKNYELKLEIKNLDDSIYSICEKRSKKFNSIEIIACCNKNLNLIDINKTNLKYSVKQYQIPDIICFSCCDMNNNNYIISGESIVVDFEDLFDTRKLSKTHKFLRKTYRSSIKINDKIAALTSNSLIKNGEDCLLLCNIKKQKIEMKISGYSHIYDSNGLASIIIENKTILLSGCKKYFQDQKNGILLVYNLLEKEDKIKEKFYPTGNFEVNCICPIYDIQNNNINSDNINESYMDNIQKTPTKFFLAGGFDSEKGEGIIQLYKVSNDNEDDISSIEYLQDIEYDSSEFQGFEMTVTCIKQSEINGNIIISCLDGNIYLFSRPNFEFYFQENYI